MLLFREFGILAVLIPIIWGLIEGRFLFTKKVEVPLNNYDGKRIRIALISDVHLGLLVGKHGLRRIINNIRKNDPDIIVAAGDILDTHPKFLKHLKGMIKEIPSIATSYFVVGNHEFYHGYTDAKEYMASLGYKVLDNKVMKDKKSGIYFAGVDDPQAFKNYDEYGDKIDKLVEEVPEGKPLVFINHQPIHFRKSADKGVGLMLSGHTHAGQMFPSGLITNWIFKDGYKGLNRYNDSYLYVCIGSGTWGPPLRIGAPSEIVIIDLLPQ
jgi:predicted MPP superfamily phosphohydrolase